jgi:hypothetical protein
MMVYYKDKNITIRSMEQEDSQKIYDEELAQNWHPSKEIYDGNYLDQESNKRIVFIAENTAIYNLLYV